MTWVGWQPVIVALEGALVVLIPAATLYLKALLNRQTERIAQSQASSQEATRSVLQPLSDLTRQVADTMTDKDLRITISSEQPLPVTVETSPPSEGEASSGHQSQSPTDSSA